MTRRGRAPAAHRRCAGAATVLLLLLASCGGLEDRRAYEDESGQLRAEAQRVVDETAQEVSRDGDNTAAAVQRKLQSHVPGPPTGQVLPPSGPAAPGRARVGFALYGKVDGYGPGGTTVTLRMCVRVTMSPPPDLTSTIEDTDCGTLAPKADSLVKFTP